MGLKSILEVFKEVMDIRNRYEIKGSITTIFIDTEKGVLEFLVSTNKLEILDNYSGKFVKTGKGKHIYGIGSVKYKDIEHPYLHRLLTNAPKGLVVDHINHDTFDNTNENLRIVTASGNARNRIDTGPNGPCGTRGVYLCESTGKYNFIINRKYNKEYDRFDNFEDAKKASDDYFKDNPEYTF
ncbi:HNH endonuclease [Paenibacillus harenae]|uniref:HNH endonuclease n=1 Tax=Paenibacillus harenae TaxID=306543 RepID=UPI00278DA003|nr:HNH endonuclease [Paenibacillus harenae]MDQ0062366.1 hypothetical protein [Paenibacillus harenae]